METSSFSNKASIETDKHLLITLENIDDGFICMDMHWCCTYVNHAATYLLRKPQEDLLGKNIWEVFPELVGSVFWKTCFQAAETKKRMEVEDLAPTTDQWFSLSISPSPVGFMLSFHETTHLNQRTQESQRDQDQTQLQMNLMQLAYDAIIVRDPTSAVVSWNQGAEKLYGWTEQEVKGKITHDLFQTQFPVSREALDRILATGDQWEGELHHIRKDGAEIIVESRQVMVRNTENNPLAIMEINRDITERKQREQENQEYYRTIVQTANEGIWLINLTGSTLFINERMAQMLGYSAEEIIGHTATEFMFPEDRARAQKHRANNLQGDFGQFEFRYQRKDGSPLFALACTSPVRNGRGEITGVLGMLTDLTENKWDEEMRLQLAALVSSADIPIIGKTREGIITSWNKAAEQMYGHSENEAVGQPITLIFPEDRQDEFVRIMERITRGERVDLYETERQRKDGSIIPVSVTISPVYNSEGHIIGASDIAHDITERKRIRAQEQFLIEVSKILSSSLDYQKTLANVARLVVPEHADWFAVDLVDQSGQFELIELMHTDANLMHEVREFRERFPADSAAAMGAMQVVRTGQAALYAELTDDLLASGIKNEEELALVRRMGYKSAIQVPLTARGQTFGVVSFAATRAGKKYDKRDLALVEEVGRRAGIALDNAQLYHQTRQSRDQLEIILQGVADGIIVYGPDDRIMYANESAAQMTDSGSTNDMLNAGEAEIVTRFEITDERGQPIPFSEFTHRRVFAGASEAQATMGYKQAGSTQPERWSFLTSRPVIASNGEVEMVVTIIHDITERMTIERRKDAFISMASHELKTPVTSLKGFTNVLQRRLTKQEDTQALHYLNRMDAQLNKLTSLINELLDISRMQSGKLALRMEPVDLDGLIDETVENVQAATTTHSLEIVGRSGAQVMADKERLGQVFINLFTNAIKYSPEANQVIIRHWQDGELGKSMVSVQDFGIGIDKAHHDKIFERFYQVSDPDEKTYPGLGIGLSISSEIVARHQGTMWVESSKGQGSIFFVALPLLDADGQTNTCGNER